jgi:uncharacterized protein (TIGR02466 family)
MIVKILENFSIFLFNYKLYKITNVLNKFIGLLDKNKKNLFFKYSFYLRKKIYNKEFLEKVYPPKVFLIKNVNFNSSIFAKIKKYQENIPANEYDYHGHKNTYQSLHNLGANQDFSEYAELFMKVVQQKIIPFYSEKKIKLILEKLWFVITKKEGMMKKHQHPDGELSGVLYLKCDNTKNPGSINLYNYSRNMFYFVAENIDSPFIKHKYTKKIFKHNPGIGDLLIFDSYIDHSVDNSSKINGERISMPFDISLDFSN